MVEHDVISIQKIFISVYTEKRFEELIAECDAIFRDALLVSESCRAQEGETVKLKDGHH